LEFVYCICPSGSFPALFCGLCSLLVCARNVACRICCEQTITLVVLFRICLVFWMQVSVYEFLLRADEDTTFLFVVLRFV
jgi:hypothetical protein